MKGSIFTNILGKNFLRSPEHWNLTAWASGIKTLVAVMKLRNIQIFREFLFFFFISLNLLDFWELC